MSAVDSVPKDVIRSQTLTCYVVHSCIDNVGCWPRRHSTKCGGLPLRVDLSPLQGAAQGSSSNKRGAESAGAFETQDVSVATSSGTHLIRSSEVQRQQRFVKAQAAVTQIAAQRCLLRDKCREAQSRGQAVGQHLLLSATSLIPFSRLWLFIAHETQQW